MTTQQSSAEIAANSIDGSRFITAIEDLVMLKVSGNDAAQFLQGQLTCNIKDITDKNSFYAAFCNAKGRAISTLLIIKIEDGFMLVLPAELIEKVRIKLQMYVLRSDVKIHPVSDEWSLFGVISTANLSLPLPEQDFAVTENNCRLIKLPAPGIGRYLVLGSTGQCIALWSELTEQYGGAVGPAALWRYLDISAGIAWLTLATSEQYIPQMLNVDKLGGISFKKGCYTGQEIIARTHYLGKAKRALFVAECSVTALIDENTQIISADSQQSLGKVLSLQADQQHIRMLIVMSSEDSGLKNLMLNNPNQDKIHIIDFQ